MTPEIDFHLIPHNQTKIRLIEFLQQSHDLGARRCRVIHGKGVSSKKLQIYHYLEESPLVSGYDDDGSNWGVTIVELVD